jgi:hypothetical protein
LAKDRADIILRHLAAGLTDRPGTPNAEPDRRALLPYAALDLGTAFAKAGEAPLLFLLLSAEPPPKANATDLARLCQEAVGKGTLPVLVLGDWQAKKRMPWERFIGEVRQVLPGLPIIDLAEVTLFLQRQDPSFDPKKLAANPDQLYAGLEAGVGELDQRIAWMLSAGGVRQEAVDGGGPPHPEPGPPPRRPPRRR